MQKIWSKFSIWCSLAALCIVCFWNLYLSLNSYDIASIPLSRFYYLQSLHAPEIKQGKIPQSLGISSVKELCKECKAKIDKKSDRVIRYGFREITYLEMK